MKFIIQTYGCQMNVSDSELVSSVLIEGGWEQTDSIDEADLILFNTCSVRQHAEERVLGRVSNDTHRKIAKPHLKIGILGCMAQRMGKRLLDKKYGIDFVVGVDQYHRLPEIVSLPKGINTDFDFEQIYLGAKPKHQSKTSAFVTIMRGCDNYCTYCIVPLVRGRERSIPFQQIYDEVSKCGDLGMKDVTLLGQNVNSYYFEGFNLPQLLKKLSTIKSIYRLRFITSHPKDLTDELVDCIASLDKVCNHVHLPMQSGDNNVLRAMNRNYSIETYTDLVNKLRKYMPDIAITTDIIAGFPGETESMFENTLKAIQSIEFDHAFCFKYSQRSGTAAADMPDQITEENRISRLIRLIDIQRAISLQKYSSQIGKTIEVYVETISRRSLLQVSGKTADYKIAVLGGNLNDIGNLKKAKVVGATAGTLICE